MSYDIYLISPQRYEHETNGECRWDQEHECPGVSLEVGNITYNIGGMWHDALGFAGSTEHPVKEIMGWGESNGRFGIHAFEGAPGVEAAGPLMEAVRRMEADPDRYRAMNPENGWGNADGAREFLRRLANMAAECPTFRIRVT